MRRWIPRVIATLSAALAAYIALLAFPQPLFPYRLARGNAALYADRPLPGPMFT